MNGMACFPVFIFLPLIFSFCKCDDQLTQAKKLYPGDMLVSQSGVFALGFFSPATSNQSLFLGIWYNNIPERTYVWIANRDKPITAPSSAMLAISNSSNFVLSDLEGHTFWTTMANINTRGDRAYAVLLDSGNLVLRLPDNTTAWQSFDHPTDTLLPNMKFFLRYKARVTMRLVAWKGPNDPSTGDFSYHSDPRSNLQAFIWHGTKPYYRFIALSLNIVLVSGEAYGSNIATLMYKSLVNTGDELYIMYTTSDGSPYTRIKLDYMGNMRFLSWNGSSSSWTVISQQPAAAGDCNLYASCGPFGYCDFTLTIPRCQCLDGFEPSDFNSLRGCRRKQQLGCGGRNHFVTMSGMKLPDKFLQVQNRSFEECMAKCSHNCSCMAYAYAYGNLTKADTMSDQSRCLLWTGDLADMARASLGDNLYLRLADSPGHTSEDKKKNRYLVVVLVTIIPCLLMLTCIYLVRKWQSKGKRRNNKNQNRMLLGNLRSQELIEQNLEFSHVNFEYVVAATNNFSDSNILGKGGFGKVYKGKLEGGREVAVKRLNTGCTQGIEHFTNEVVLIAKLQHKNLVRLLGCCIHGDEKLLIFEYLRNKSLDYFLFDDSKKPMLDWQTRFNIIKGVARGLVYLHQDSRMRVIHRDLKASNILLDEEMSPKISDFGMARIFGGNQHQANTKHVVGTYFGVLLLEIVSGLKISSSKLTPNFFSLTAYAWRLWKDGNATELLDKCIHVGLLCVQDHPNDRPSMSSVVFMLENESMLLPAPKQPVYFEMKNHGTQEATEESAQGIAYKFANTDCSAFQGIYKRENMTTLHVVIFMFLISFCQSDDRLTPAKPPIFPGGDKLISDGGVFALGFSLTTTNSTPSLLYLGIWYNNIPERTYVWVANRDNPITTHTARLAVTNTSGLVLSDSKGRTIWTTANTVTIGGGGATAVLQNTGNFVLRLPDHPTDTILPGLPGFKLWTNYKNHEAVRVVAWRGRRDPSTGEFSLSGDPDQWGLQIVIWHGASPSWRSGVWNGATATGLTRYKWSQIVDNGEEIYAIYNAADGILTHWKLDCTGNVSFRAWNNVSSTWTSPFERPSHGCLHYGACGPFGYCDITGSFQECKCLDGFEPADGFSLNSSRGCRRKEELRCGGQDHFFTLPGMKVPDKFLYIRNRTFEECADECDRNCSCTAYAYANLRTILTTGDPSRCLVWMGELLDSEKAGAVGENLYLRLAGSPAGLCRLMMFSLAIVPTLSMNMTINVILQ
uniref:non-specific serine/threonine protein kinase n=1 Tax=Oryza glumipatula TaxID=40148 RepID=A0A0D9ZR80_9ORYZ